MKTKQLPNSLRVYLFCLLVTLLSGCQKSAPEEKKEDPDGYIQFKIDGVQKKYSVRPSAGPITQTEKKAVYHIGVSASADNSNSGGQMIYIVMYGNNKIEAPSIFKDPMKTYTSENIPGTGNKRPQVGIGYTDENKVSWTTVGALTEIFGQPGFENLVADAVSEIIEIKNGYIKGTFSSTLFASDLKSFKKVTNGEFYIKMSETYFE
ncbi:hypothetical protein [Niabella aquatica]